MLKAKDSGGKIVCSYIDAKKGENYFCPSPDCGKKVLLKIHNNRITHFAHYPNAYCYTNEERDTQEHDEMKIKCLELLKPIYPDIDFEVWLIGPANIRGEIKNQRADLYSKQSMVAFEIQCSPISFMELTRRSYYYNEMGRHVVWIFGAKNYLKLRRNAFGAELLREKEVLKYYFNSYGRFYAYNNGLFAIHFLPYRGSENYTYAKFIKKQLNQNELFVVRNESDIISRFTDRCFWETQKERENRKRKESGAIDKICTK